MKLYQVFMKQSGHKMEHYPIIQSLCRIALATGEPALRQQVERLKEAARKEGDEHAARSLSQLLSRSLKASEMAPSKMTQSFVGLIQGEELSRNTPRPVDKETSAPLADIFFPDDLPKTMPFFSEPLTKAATTILDEWKNTEALYAMGVIPAKSCLIYGSPGTGKTTLALWLARELGVPAVVARLDGLISSFLGTTARNMGNLFTFANRYKCLLILDEFDAVAKVRDDPHEVGEIKRVVNALLQNIDMRRQVGITIAVTNHEKLLDPAIWRRFEITLQIPKPDMAGRTAIIKRYLPPVEINEPAERLLAWLTEGFSGAEIETFIIGLKKYFAIQKTDQSSLIAALRHLSILSGNHLEQKRKEILLMDMQSLAQYLLSQSGLGFTQADLASLLQKNKATVNRWVREIE